MNPAEPTTHSSNCVCVSCLAVRPSLAPTVAEALERERSKPQACALNQVQRMWLNRFTKAWNKDRYVRGLPTLTADDALTQGLQALTEMVTEANNQRNGT